MATERYVDCSKLQFLAHEMYFKHNKEGEDPDPEWEELWIALGMPMTKEDNGLVILSGITIDISSKAKWCSQCLRFNDCSTKPPGLNFVDDYCPWYMDKWPDGPSGSFKK